MRMMDAREHLRFANELTVADLGTIEELQRDLAVEARIARTEDAPECAVSELLEDFQLAPSEQHRRRRNGIVRAGDLGRGP